MENLRWILILSGVAILAVLYFSGKPKRSRGTSELTAGRRNPANDEYLDPLMGDSSFRDDPVDDFGVVDQDDFTRTVQIDPLDSRNLTAEMDNYLPDGAHLDDSQSHGHGHGRGRDGSAGRTSLAQKIELISERLTPRRRQRIAAFEPRDIDKLSSADSQSVTKIVTLHVVAPQDQLLDGGHLLDVFDRRGYHYGDMHIFHSMHKGETVFSIAKMVEPGFFDVEDIESFVTPGVTLILQLPGPVAADVAFEVLISEAYEIAGELNAAVLDGDRNNLSKQTLQHMRESIYEYMHRQKYFSKVPS